MNDQLESEVQIVNLAQAEAWNGEEGERWTRHAERYERTGRRTWDRFVGVGLIESDSAVLDIGCGTGQSTRDAARLASRGSALGIDLSAPMLEHARRQSTAEGLANITFVRADAQVHDFDQESCDLAISSFGSMFFEDPVAAFTNIGVALRPGGRLALLSWRDLARNEWITALRSALAVGRTLPEPPPDAPSPFAHADTERVRQMLTSAGFDDIEFESIDEPMEFGSDADDAFAFIRTFGIVEGLTHDLDEPDRAQALENLRATVVDHTGPNGTEFTSSVWLITAGRP